MHGLYIYSEKEAIL